MEVGTVAALGGAGPHGVAAAPAFAGLVVAQVGDNVIVNVAGFLERCGVAGGLLAGEVGDGAAEGDEFVGFEIAPQERASGGKGGGSGAHGGRVQVYGVL